MARVRVHILVGFVLGAGFCKNRDKQLTHIVRVIVRLILKLSPSDEFVTVVGIVKVLKL
jgi:hypothetical protein